MIWNTICLIIVQTVYLQLISWHFPFLYLRFLTCVHKDLAECQIKPLPSPAACLIKMQCRHWCPHKGSAGMAWHQNRLGFQTWNQRPLLHLLGNSDKSQLRAMLLSLSVSPLSCSCLHTQAIQKHSRSLELAQTVRVLAALINFAKHFPYSVKLELLCV